MEGRGRFLRRSGPSATSCQPTMLQVVANLAMEPPVGDGSEPMQQESQGAPRHSPADRGDGLVRGQYRGYRAEADVAGFAGGDICRNADPPGFLALAGRTVLYPRRKAFAGDRYRSRRRLAASAATDISRDDPAAIRLSALSTRSAPGGDRDRRHGEAARHRECRRRGGT